MVFGTIKTKTMTSTMKFYKILEKYALIKDSQFILNIPLALLSELIEMAEEKEKTEKMSAIVKNESIK